MFDGEAFWVGGGGSGGDSGWERKFASLVYLLYEYRLPMEGLSTCSYRQTGKQTGIYMYIGSTGNSSVNICTIKCPYPIPLLYNNQ